MVNVKSEIGQLEKVLLHRPGAELEHLVPKDMGLLLFDDIPYLRPAQNEHDFFARTLKENGCEVFYIEDLLAETLKSSTALKEEFVETFIKEAGPKAAFMSAKLKDLLLALPDEATLVNTMIKGITSKEVEHAELSPLSTLLEDDNEFILDPIPNLYFSRDAFSFIGNGVSLNKMYSFTRQRETLFGEYILKHHKLFKDVKFYYQRDLPHNIEGGDILVLSAEVLMVGVSQRTSAQAVEELARNLFADESASYKEVIAFSMPNARAFMHLDTVCTQVDRDAFIVHPGIRNNIRLFSLTAADNAAKLQVRELSEDLSTVLKRVLHLDSLRLIHCGGHDSVAAAREQWNDGSNTLCVAPGKIVVYDRNYISNAILRDNGIELLELPSAELSRGRGGPRCMSMPIARAAL